MISNRVQALHSSGIRKAFNAAQSMRDPVNLSIGVPAFDPPQAMLDGVRKALDERRFGYTHTLGIPSLRDAIRKKHGLTDSSFDVCVTSGVSSAFFAAYATTLDVGDEVLIPDPFFGLYRDQAALIGAVPVCYSTYPDFIPDPAAIEPLITHKTRVLVVNSPGNPTGAVIPSERLDALVALARKHDLWIISDEIYSEFWYSARHATCLGRYEKLFLLDGFSKSHGIPGWRLGYLIAPAQLMADIQKVVQYTTTCAPSLAQFAAVEAADFDLTSIREEYSKKRDLLADGIGDRFRFARPEGAFYLFAEVPAGETGDQFFHRALARNLIVVPGEAFSRQDTHIRISFSVSWEKLRQGIELLNELTHQ